jgi:cysteinyl-tRNA synthetase
MNIVANVGRQINLSNANISPELAAFRDRLLTGATQAETDFEARVRRLVTERETVRKQKRFDESDKIRNHLAAMGVTVVDNPDGTSSWHIASKPNKAQLK